MASVYHTEQCRSEALLGFGNGGWLVPFTEIEYMKRRIWERRLEIQTGQVVFQIKIPRGQPVGNIIDVDI